MNLIQQAVERAKQLESEGKVVPPVTQTGPRPESKVSAAPAPAPSGPRIGLASLPHIQPVAARGPMPVLLVLLIALLALGGGALLYFFLAKSQAPETRDAGAAATAAPAPKTAVAAASPAAAPPAASTAAAAVPVAATPAAAAPLDEARLAVEGWARAWSDRDVNAYLAFYGPSFRPDRGQPRQAWEDSRRVAIEKKRQIAVTVRDLKLEAQPGDRVVARFTQDYSADTYRENGTSKTLVLAREPSGWRIVSETIGAARARAR